MEHSDDMVLDHVQRITTLEDKVRVVESVTTNISTSLDKVTKEISAIKWLTAGGFGFYIIHEIGLIEAVKLLF